nr:MAG TPA: hypothetical protein [Caudoviricetes sp.]
MNLLDKYGVSTESVQTELSMEQIAVAIEEAEEALAEAETQEDEIQEENQNVERLETAAKEIELQNEVAQNLVEDREDGKLTETEQTALQLARRATVAGLGIDPESEEGDEAISEVTDTPAETAATEAMDDKETFLKKVVAGAKKALSWLFEKIGNFFAWATQALAKIGNGAKAKYAKLLKALEAAKPEDEAAFIKAQEEYKFDVSNNRIIAVLTAVTKDGKFISLNEAQRYFANGYQHDAKIIDEITALANGVNLNNLNDTIAKLDDAKDALLQSGKEAHQRFFKTVKEHLKALSIEEAKKLAQDSLKNIDGYTKAVDKMINQYRASVSKMQKAVDGFVKFVENVDVEHVQQAKRALTIIQADIRMASLQSNVFSGAMLRSGAIAADHLLKCLNSKAQEAK